MNATALAFAHARRFYRWAFERWPEDACQSVHLALASAGDTVEEIRSAVGREMRALQRELGMPAKHNSKINYLEKLSVRRSRIAKALRLRDKGLTANEINAALGGSSAQCAARHASGQAYRGDRGNAARWGDYEQRRQQAREMRVAGMTLKSIQQALGYRSVASVHYAVGRKVKG